MTSAAPEAPASSAHARRHPPRRVPTGRALAIGLGILAVLLLIQFLAPKPFDGDLPGRLQEGVSLTLTVLLATLPWLVMGVLLSIVVQVWLPADAVQRWLPETPWARRLVLSVVGMIIPVGEGGNVPFARGLMMRGLAPAEALVFVMAAPVINPVVIVTTHLAFGWSGGILIARLVGGLLIANLIGWVFSRHPDPQSLLTGAFARTRAQVLSEPGTPTRRSLLQFLIELRAVMPALVIGSLLAGGLRVLIPRDALLAVASNPVLAVLVLAGVALIAGVGSNSDATAALALASTFSAGALVAYLLIGPLVDVKMLALLRTTFTWRALGGAVALVVLSGCAIGMAVSVLV